jgi:hypothetical protein
VRAAPECSTGREEGKEKFTMKKKMMPWVVALICGGALANPELPPGFSARLIAPVLDGVMPELSAIDHPSFGSGVVSATVANNIATFRLISPAGVISNLGTYSIDNLVRA